jgi:diguanylate cyclase (GGDEF)-like protein
MLSDTIFQLRFLDKNGLEVVRVDKKIDYHIIKKENLQNKKNRYYFNDIYQLEENEIWLSNIDLNVEHGKIEYPHKPTLRIGLPVFVDGTKEGILIVNLNMLSFLQNFQKSSFFKISIIDKDKNTLITTNNKYNWSKYLKSGKKINEIYPSINIKNINISSNDLFIKKLNIQSRELLYTVFEQKPIDTFTILEEKTKPINHILLSIFLALIPISYIMTLFLVKYITKVRKHKLFYEYNNLTNLYNSDFLNDALNRELEIINDKKDIDTSIILLSINNHNIIIDKFGKETYEEVFKKTAMQTSKVLKTYDILARLSNNKFIVILRDKNENSTSICSQKIKEKVEATNIQNLNITLSVAITKLKPNDTKKSLLERVFKVLEAHN